MEHLFKALIMFNYFLTSDIAKQLITLFQSLISVGFVTKSSLRLYGRFLVLALYKALYEENNYYHSVNYYSFIIVRITTVVNKNFVALMQTLVLT